MTFHAWFNWGGRYHDPHPKQMVRTLGVSEVVPCDRWHVKLTQHGQTRREFMMNYFSIGIDAQIARNFHELRENKPYLFKSQTANKIIYALLGVNAHWHAIKMKRHGALSKGLTCTLDGKEIEIPSNITGIILLNIASYAGGMNLWGKGSRTQPQSVNDGTFEVVGIRSPLHVAMTRFHLASAIRLGQGQTMVIEAQTEGSMDTLYYQIDGEAESCCIRESMKFEIQHKDTVSVLKRN